MQLNDAINQRRAYRSLSSVEVTDDQIEQLAKAAQLAPSCYNNQPWRFVFVREEKLKELHNALSKGNEWAYKSSMIIAVFSKKEFDCALPNRDYFLFGAGMAVSYLMLKATEMHLVTHPIAGFSEKKAKEILSIPEEMTLITLIIVGKHNPDDLSELNDKQKEDEKVRPKRKELPEFVYYNQYSE